MSNKLYEDLWREAVSELVDHLEAEHPEQKGAAPKTLEDWARIYIRYLQTLRKLDEAHAGVVQPQKRRAVRGALDACLGRVLELRAWLVLLNKDVDVVDLEAFLENLGLTPEALELPVPVYFRRERAQQLEARQAAIAAAAASGLPAGEAAAAEAVSDSEGSSSEDELQHQPEPLAEAPAVAAAPAARAQAATAPLAVAITLEEQQLQNEAASRRIQAGARGWLARRRVRAERQAELELLGMAPAAGTPAVAQLRGRLAAIREERAARQVQRQAEYEVALVSVKEKVRRQEGYGMREKIQDQLNDWFIKSRDPETGDYSDLPEEAKGGSKAIVHPPPPEPSPEQAAAADKAAAASAGKASKGKGGKAGAEAPAATVEFVQDMRQAVQHYADSWQDWQEGDPAGALLPPELQGLPTPRGGTGAERCDIELIKAEVRPVAHEELRLEADVDMRRLIRSIKDLITCERDTWRKKKGKKGKKGDKKGAGAAAGKKKAGAAGGKGAGKGNGKGGKGGGEDGKPKKPRKDLTAGRSIESIFAELAAAGLVHLPTPQALANYLGGPRLVQLQSGEGGSPGAAAGPKKPRAGGKASNTAPSRPAGGKAGGGKAGEAAPLLEYPEASMAQARQEVAAACVLPLGAPGLCGRVPRPQTVLLYGPSGTGKTLLANAVAHEAGATLFDLSPASTQGKYPGKEVAVMVHMVFKAARALAPSVVLVEDAEKVFISDKTRAKALAGGGEPCNRIKKHLLAEAAELAPVGGVLVLCTSREPQTCVKKDERVLLTFLQKTIALPLPDYGSRLLLLHEFAQRLGEQMQQRRDEQQQEGDEEKQPGAQKHQLAALALQQSWQPGSASLSLAARLTEGYTTGQLREVVQRVAQRLMQQPGQPSGSSTSAAGSRSTSSSNLSVADCLVEVLPGVTAVSEEERAALREWALKAHTPLPPEEDEGKKGDKKKKK